MPILDQDFILTTPQIAVSFALKPDWNNLYSLYLLNKVNHLAGLDSWVTDTAAALSPEVKARNQVVSEGLHYVIYSAGETWPTFPAYLEDLAARNPADLRDRLFARYFDIAREIARQRGESPALLAQSELLADPAQFLAFLEKYFIKIDKPLETEAYHWLIDPPAMQTMILNHLRFMWQTYLAPEWQRTHPLLEESVAAFKQLDFFDMSAVQVVETVIGTEIKESWIDHINRAKKLVFVPSPHVGAYAGKFWFGGGFTIFFQPRLPEGLPGHSFPALTRSELVSRFSALGDDSRLRILKFLADHGEQYAKDIMTRLTLSQSAASRHLRQLSAAAYLTERRREGAKCYRLNPDRLEDTFKALEQFLNIG